MPKKIPGQGYTKRAPYNGLDSYAETIERFQAECVRLGLSYREEMTRIVEEWLEAHEPIKRRIGDNE
jgi:hypothetical protein